MLKVLWKWLKENFKEVLTVCTAVLTVIYAVFRLVAYVYWYGYFKKLNIDNRFIKVDYEGTIFQVIFFFVVVLVMIYMLDYLFSYIGSIAKVLWNKDAKWYAKFFKCILIAFLSVLFWGFFGSVANAPLAITLCVFLEIEVSAFNVVWIVILMSIAEIYFAVAMKISNHNSGKGKQDFASKVHVTVTMGVICIGVIFAGTYYSGSVALEKQNKVTLVENGQYAVTYNDGSRYVLHEVTVENGKASIDRNKQKVVDIEGLEYEVIYVDEIEIVLE